MPRPIDDPNFRDSTANNPWGAQIASGGGPWGSGNQIQELGGSRGGLAGLVGALRQGGLGGGMNPGDSPIGGRGWAGLNPGVGGYTDYPGGGREIPMPKLPGGPIGWGMRDTPPGLLGRSSEPDYGTGLPTQFDAGGRSGAQLRSDWAALDPAAQKAAYKQFQTASPEMQASVLAATGVDAQGNVLPTPGSYTGGGIKQLRGSSKAFNAMGATPQASARPSSQDLMGMMGPAATADTARGGGGMMAGGSLPKGVEVSQGATIGAKPQYSGGYDPTAGGGMQMQGPTSLGPEYGGTMGGGGGGGGALGGMQSNPGFSTSSDWGPQGGGGASNSVWTGGVPGGGGGLQGLAGPQGRQPNRRPSSQDIMSMFG